MATSKINTAKTRRSLLGAATAIALILALPVSVALADDKASDPSVLGNANAGVVTDAQGRVQLVVDADDSLSDDEVKAIGQLAGVALELNSVHSDEANVYVGWVAQGNLERALEVFTGTQGVEAAEANQQMQAFGFPDDPLYQYQWHFEQIDMQGAWKSGSGKDVVVAIIDTGVAYKSTSDKKYIQASDLKKTAFVPGYDFVADDTEPLDEHGHGTHVAGTVAQTTNNAHGVAGIAHKAKIMPLRVLNRQGFGSTSDIADSIRFAADNGAKVINMSLGGPLPSLVMRSAIRHAHAKGVTVIAAAGNAGRRMRSYPAAYKYVIAVAATQYDKKTTFYSQWGPFVDIAAPGGNTRVDQNGDGRVDGVMQQTLKDGDPTRHDFALFMGTSMASPHVAGVAAILVGLGVNNPDAVEAILKESAAAIPEGVDLPEERYGAGILDANAAANRALGCSGTSRLGLAGLLAFLVVLAVRRKDVLAKTSVSSWLPIAVGLVAGASGLFVLPMFLGDSGVLGTVANILGRPLAMLDLTLLGPGHHQNALLASALIPVGAVLLGLGNKTTRALAAGLAIGFAAFLGHEAFLLAADVQWIPGLGLLDRAWLAVNAAISLAVGYLALVRY